MAIVVINTPQGPKTVRIAGTKPNEEELRRMREVFPAPEGQASAYKVREVVDEEEITEETTQSPTTKRPQGGRIEEGVSGEIEDKTFRFDFGQMDTLEEKHGMLLEEFGEEAVQFNPETTNFIIDQSLVPSHKRKEYGLDRYGKIYADSPELNWTDVIDFGGEAGPEILTGTAAAIATMGWSLLPSAIAVGLAAGGGKAVAETIDWARGLNKQTASEVGANIALVTAIDGVATYGGGLAGKALGRMWKGPGPDFEQTRADELLASGEIKGLFKKGKAEKIAREEQQARYTKMLTEKGNPSIQAATGKSLAARALKVNELILGNETVARENETWVRKIIKDVQEGNITQDDAKKEFHKSAQSIARLIRERTSDPVRMATEFDEQLREIIQPILKDFEAAYIPEFGAPPQLYDRVKMATNLFKNQSSVLYNEAYETIGAKYIPIDSFLEKLSQIRIDNKISGKMPGAYFNNFAEHVMKATEQHRLDLGTNATPFVSGIKELEQLKAEIRASAGSPELIGQHRDHQIRNLADAVDEAILQAQRDFAEIATHKGRVPIRDDASSSWATAEWNELVEQGMREGKTRADAKIQATQIQNELIAVAEEKGRGAVTASEMRSGEIHPATTELLTRKTRKLQQGYEEGFDPSMVVAPQEILTTPIDTLIRAMETGKTSVGLPDYRMSLTFDPVTAEQSQKGIALLQAAKNHWSDGMKVFNTGAVNNIIKTVDDGYWANDQSLWQHIIKPNDSGVLERYLKAATPRDDVILPIIQKEKSKRVKPENKPSYVLQKAIEQVDNGELGLARKYLSDKLRKVHKIAQLIPAKTARLDKNLETFQQAQEYFKKNLEDLKLMVEAGANPQAYKEAARDNLARVWDKQVRMDSTINGVFEPGVYANKFFDLGKEVQDLLFGAEKAKEFRDLLPEMWLVGKDKDELVEHLPVFAREPGTKPAPEIVQQIENLKAAIKNNEDMSDGALLRALKMGEIENPMDVFSAIMRNPEGYDKLKAVVGEDVLEAPGNFKDSALANIIYTANKGSLTSLDVQKGDWGRAFKREIADLNKNGALDKIYGKDVVNKLNKLAKDAMDISDIPLTGYGGLAAATAGLAIMGALVSFNVATVGGALGALLGAFVLARGLRNPYLLRTMTSTKFTKDQYEAAIKAGADLPTWKELRKDDPFIFALNYAARFAAREGGLLLSSGVLGIPFEEAARRPDVSAVRGAVRDISPSGQAIVQRQSEPRMRTRPGTNLSTMQFPTLDDYNQTLLELEQRKLLGVQ